MKESLEQISGKYILLHSGYGGGQYIGRVKSVVKREYSVSLLLFPEVMRYQPKTSTHFKKVNNNCLFWVSLSSEIDHELSLKLLDRLYLIGEKVTLESFVSAKKPVNPEDFSNVKALTGKASKLQILYAGAPLNIVN